MSIYKTCRDQTKSVSYKRYCNKLACFNGILLYLQWYVCDSNTHLFFTLKSSHFCIWILSLKPIWQSLVSLCSPPSYISFDPTVTLFILSFFQQLFMQRIYNSCIINVIIVLLLYIIFLINSYVHCKHFNKTNLINHNAYSFLI